MTRPSCLASQGQSRYIEGSKDMHNAASRKEIISLHGTAQLQPGKISQGLIETKSYHVLLLAYSSYHYCIAQRTPLLNRLVHSPGVTGAVSSGRAPLCHGTCGWMWACCHYQCSLPRNSEMKVTTAHSDLASFCPQSCSMTDHGHGPCQNSYTICVQYACKL